MVTNGGRSDTTPDASLPLAIGTVVVSLSLIAGVLCALDAVVGLFGQTIGSLEAGFAISAVGVADFLHYILTTFPLLFDPLLIAWLGNSIPISANFVSMEKDIVLFLFLPGSLHIVEMSLASTCATVGTYITMLAFLGSGVGTLLGVVGTMTA